MLIQLQYITTTLHENNTDDSGLHGHCCENLKFHFWTPLHKKGELGRNYEIAWQAKRDTIATIK